MRSGLTRLAGTLRRSPLGSVLLIGTGLVLVLLARGLDIGPLHTDVKIMRAWFAEFGTGGFSRRYFEVEQRHLLVGPFYTVTYLLFGEHDLPYHLIFQFSRVLEGAFLAGIVTLLTGRRALALGAGLALTVTLVRVPELYEGRVWIIETTLPLLLASSYFTLLSLRRPRRRWLWYALAVLCYAVSVLIYESGVPWVLVNALLGWLARSGVPWRSRVRQVALDVLPPLLFALALSFVLLVVLDPWYNLGPNDGLGWPLRFARTFREALSFPARAWDLLRTFGQDGYARLVVVISLGAALGLGALARVFRPDPADGGAHSRQDFAALLALALAMIAAALLVGTSNSRTNQEYIERMSFARGAGITLFYVTLIFAALDRLRAAWRGPAALALTGLLVVGPGFAGMWIYQTYAQQSRAEIGRMTAAILDVRRTLYAPVHLIVLTDPDWPPARFRETSDLVLHEVQQQLWERGGDATLDILKTGGFADDYATHPGTCTTVSGEGSTGICLTAGEVYSSRFAFGATHPDADLVLLHYDDASGTMNVLPRLSVDALSAEGYNLSSAGPRVVETNRERLAVPLVESAAPAAQGP